MTHDELLAKIDDELFKHGQRGNIVKHSFALRAVVELHKPKNYIHNNGVTTEAWCTGDTDVLVSYPCPTIQAIERELQ